MRRISALVTDSAVAESTQTTKAARPAPRQDVVDRAEVTRAVPAEVTRAVPNVDRLPDEEELVRRAATDPDAFAKLYRHYVYRIHAFAQRRAGSREIADDVTSATFEKALRKLPEFRPRGGGFGAWLFRIAANELTDHHRREARPRSDRGQRAMSMMQPADDDVDPLILDDDRSRVRLAIERLSPRHQQAINLRYLADLSNEEAAAAMGLSRPHMAVTLHRAVAALRRVLSEEGVS
jgi:RNA polymerase sigma-70 factor (ECF subfamily)